MVRDYRLVQQYKMQGGQSPEEAASKANEWSRQGYTVEITAEEKKGGDEAIALDPTYLVEAERTVVELDEFALAEAMAELQENANIKRAKHSKKR